MSRSWTTRILAAAGGLLMLGGLAAAQDYPNKAITLVVPYAAGGPTDTIARLTAEAMSKDLGQQIVVQNVTGAGGTLGSGEVARAEPDGYTMLIHHIGMSTAPSLYKELPYQPLEAFDTIGLITDAPMTVIGRKDLPANTLAELVEWVKANKDTVTLADAGVGAASNLCGIVFKNAVGVDIETVPYQGNGPIMTDLLGGHIDITCDQATNTTGPITSGQVKAYAVTTAERVPTLPDLPTTAEAGLPDLQIGVWHALYVPAGTDDAIVQRLSKALQAALKDPTLVERFNSLGTRPASDQEATPEAHREKLAQQIEFWKPVIAAAGVEPQ